MKKSVLFILLSNLVGIGFAQNVAINGTGAAPAASAMLDVASTTSGLLMPRMTSAQRTAIAAPATGLKVYDTTTGGFWYFNGTIWVQLLNTNTGWALVGNTLVGTEFMGSINAQDVKFYSNNAERMRILSSKEIVVGSTTAFVGDMFSSYATGTDIAIAGYNSGTNISVLGVNTNATAVPAHGVQGQTTAFGSAAGLRGFNVAAAIGAAQNGFGVRGSCNVTPTGTGFVMGVRGDCNGATGSTYGVYGQSASSTGFGADGVNTNAVGTGMFAVGNNAAGTYLVSGSGIASNGNAVGLFSIAKTAASGVGIVGVGNNLVASIITPASGCGVAGIGTQYGIFGIATTLVNTNPLNNSASNAAAASSGGYFELQNAGTAQTWAYVGVRDNTATNRKIIGPGTVNTVVKDTRGKLVALSCPEAPENLFQDYGQGQLVNGRAHITIDPTFAMNILVNDKHPLRVFVQLEGNCKGVFVTNKTATGFDVEELDGGNSNIPFMYTIVANRANETNPDGTIAKYGEERFPLAPGPQKTIIMKAAEENPATRNVAEDDKLPINNLKNGNKK
jgi:hypothetical protein